MSQPVTFEPGIQYVLQGVGYQVTQLLDDGTLVARNLETLATVSHRLDLLWQHWQDNSLQFARSGPNLRDEASTTLKTTYTFADLVDLPPTLQDITWHRYQLIRPLVALPSSLRTSQVVQERIRTYLCSLERHMTPGGYAFLASLRTSPSLTPSETFDGPKPQVTASDPAALNERGENSDHHQQAPRAFGHEALSADLRGRPELSARTVWRWLHRYQQSQQDIRSLVPSYHQRGPHQSQLSPLQITLLEQAIQQTYLTNVRAPVTHVITSFHTLLLAENSKRCPQEQLPIPSNMTVYRYLQSLDGKRVDAARFGQATASHNHHQFQQGPLPSRPNQRAEFDFAQLDLLVVDPDDRLPIGRPTLAAIRDKYTGYPLGVFISFDPPSYRVVMECMLYAFLPKPHVKSLFHTQHEYLAFGIPEVLVVDNAIELDRELELACLQLGIELQHMPVRKPWFKGSVERWFRTLNTDLIHATPGTTFSHFLQRGSYDSEKHACITLDRLWQLLHLWIVDVYTQEVRSGVGGHPRGKGIPALLWQQAKDEQFVPRLPPSRDDLLVLLTRTTKRKVHHYGIEFEHLLYQSPTLAPLRSKLARAKHYRTPHSDIEEAKATDLAQGIVSLKYHPGDLSRIWVKDPFSDQYLEVLAVDQQYTKDLSLWKHQVIKRAAQQVLKRQVNHEALVLAKARLQQLITDEMRLTRKIRARQTMARWWNEHVTTWINDATGVVSVSSASSTLDQSKKGTQELLLEQEPMASARPQAAMPSPQPATLALTHSVADLSATLSDLQEQVVLLPDPLRKGNQAPFETFPPLASQDRSPVGKRQRTRRGSNETTPPSRAQTAQASTAQPQQEEQALLATTQGQQTSTGEISSTNETEMTSTIDERKQSFGIETRSTRWH